MKNLSAIVVRSPTRVDLAGGTLDLWPLFSFLGPCKTVNVAISIWTTAQLTPRNDQKIEIISKDVQLNLSFESLAGFMASSDPKLLLYQVVVDYFQPQHGFTLETGSESPVGGGLGGSSSLMISMLKAFSEWLGKKWESVHQMVHVAHNLEARILSTPTGTQDYYPPASGGLNILRYSADGIEQKVKALSGSEIEKAFLLVYTGRSHHSGLNNFEVLKAAVSMDKKVLAALKELQAVSQELEEAVLHQQFSLLSPLFQREYNARIQLTPAFTSPEIEKLKGLAEENGASIKICGAGGGGCVLIWAPENKQKVAVECQKAGFQVLNANLVEPLSK